MKLPRIEFGLIVFILILVLLVVLAVQVNSQTFVQFAISITTIILIIARENRKTRSTNIHIAIPPPGHTVVNTERDAVWHEENKTIGVLSIPADVAKASIVLRNCTVIVMDIQSTTLEELVIENCIIDDFNGDFAWIEGGCTIINSTFKNVFTLSEGGHNKEEARIEGNTFLCFADFFDEIFEARFVFRNNILHQGSNLLAYDPINYTPDLGPTPLIEGNIGNLNLQGGSPLPPL